MSHTVTISTLRLQIVKVIKPVEGWDLREVEGGDVVAEKKGEESHLPILCHVRDFLDDLMYVETREDLAKFLNHYHDPGIRDNEYVGTQYYAKLDLTFKGHVHRPQKKIFLSDVREFQALVKRAMRGSVRTWRFTEIFNPESLSIDLKVKDNRIGGVCEFHEGAEACLALVYIEKALAGVTYGWCAVCGKPFRKRSAHKRKYCSEKCAHRMAMRMKRRRDKGKQ